jgi:hypothetical protein
MIANLNLKGRDLLRPISELFNQKGRSLKEFVRHSLIIDNSRGKHFCQDAFELGWMIQKASFLYKFIKQSIKHNCLLDYDKLLSSIPSLQRRLELKADISDLQRGFSSTSTTSPVRGGSSLSSSRFNSDQMNTDRVNP